MRKIFHLFAFAAAIALIFLVSCGDDDEPEPTAQEKRAEELSGTWSQSTTELTPEGVDPTILDNLTMTFNVQDKQPSTFSASGAPDLFTTSGSSTWAFSGSNVDVIVLTDVGDGVPSLTISGFTTSQMTVAFKYTTPAGRLESNERVMSLDGDYRLTMTKP